jgi:hypothetical protein
VQYIVEGSKDIGHFTLPDFDDFYQHEVFEIPNTPTIYQQSTQPVDTYGKIVILSPRRPGVFTLPGASAYINGKLVKSNPVKVTVTQPGGGPPGRIGLVDTESESELRPGEDIEAKIKKNLFLRVEANKTTCFVGEPIMVVYKAYSRLNTNSQVVKRPSLTGFSVMDMVDAYDSKPDIEIYNGLPFYTNVIRKVQLFPLQEGVFSLDPAEIESVIHFTRVEGPTTDDEALRKVLNSPPNSNNPLRVKRTPLDYRLSLTSEPLNIHVKPLPTENQPAGFEGAVGNFSLSVNVPRNTIRVGDLVKIQMVVTGSGNISLLTAPNIEWPQGVDTADPVVKETINKYLYPATGSKTFEYSFAAPDTGIIVIPSARLPYYDPLQKVYKVATSESITLHVLPVLENASLPDTANGKKSLPGQPHWYWFGLVALIIVGWITYQALHLKKSKKVAAPPPVAEKEPEPKRSVVEETLFKAQWALERGKPQLFYHELEQAIWQFMATKYNLLPSSLNKHVAVQHLRERNLAPEIISNFSSVLDELQWVLYTPDQSTHDMEKLLQKSREMLELIENS